MVVQQFSPYDVIADIAPGTIVIIGGLILIPGNQLTGISVTTGTLLFIGSYPVGRVIHALGSLAEDLTLEIPQLLSRPFAHLIPGEISDRRARYISLAYIITVGFSIIIIPVGSPFQIISIPAAGVTSGLLVLVISNIRDQASVWESATAELSSNFVADTFQSVAQEMDSSIMISSDRQQEAEQYGQAVLFGEQTLYGKYNTLTTFWRNIWLSMTLLGILGFCAAITEQIYNNKSFIPISEITADINRFLRAPLLYEPSILNQIISEHGVQFYLLYTGGAFGFTAVAAWRYHIYQRRRDTAFIHEINRRF
jgi:hypothetical protein